LADWPVWRRNKRTAPIGGAVIIVLGILAPVLYGAIGFVFGAISAFIHNLIAKRLGEIEIQLEPAAAISFRKARVCGVEGLSVRRPARGLGQRSARIKSSAGHFGLPG
jgi:hypothetical protein